MVAGFDGGEVAAIAVTQESCDPTDRGDADACQFVYATIGKIALQKANHLPAIDECLQFGRRAQILEKVSALLRALQATHCFKKRIFVASSLSGSLVLLGFHSLESPANPRLNQCINTLLQ